MKLSSTIKKAEAVVLSAAMVAAPLTFQGTKVNADAESRAATIAQIQNADSNLALGKQVRVLPNMQSSEGGANGEGVKLITDGNVDSNYIATAFNTASTSFVIDLGDTYEASGIEQIVSQYKENKEGDTPVKGYIIQYSADGINYYDVKTIAPQADQSNPTWAEEGQNNLDVQDVQAEEGAVVQYVKLTYPDSYAWGIQVREIAVLDTDSDAKTVEVEKCDDAAEVSVKSEDFNSITYNITAGENQEDYVYMVYLDGDSEIGSQVSAGQDYTVTGISGGTHTVKVVAIYDGKVSNGITSEEVTVDDVSSLITGTQNIAYVGNNADAKIISVTELYNDTYTMDTAQVALDGSLKTGEGSTVALRTKGKPVDIVIDLGDDYKAAEFEQIIIGYSNPRTYAATTTVSFSSDNDEYTEVAKNTGYVCTTDGAETADLNVFKLDNISVYGAEKAVHYVKITLDDGQSDWGYVVNEIGVILNVDVEESTIVTSKTKVEVPEIAEKEYTGETLVADIEDTEEYTVTTNEGGSDVGNYEVVLTLKDPDNYYWSDDRKAKAVTKTLSFNIAQAENAWEEELNIDSWVYGDTAAVPSSKAKFGEPTYLYSDSEDGEYTETVPEVPEKYFVKAQIDETNNYKGISAVKQFEIAKATKAAPEEISAVNTTLDTNADGKITGVTSNMEYRAAEDTDYTPITEDEIKALSVGTYYVRYAENSYYKASEETEVVIESGRKLNVQLPQGEGYLSEGVEADVNQVEYGADYAFTLKINEGYKTNDAFAVKANGETIEADSEGIYKLENITDDVEITVVGIEKDIPETTTEKTVTPTTKNPATTTAAQVKAPAKAKILKVNAKKKSSKKIKISLKKIANAKGYEIAVYASKKNAKKNKNALVTKRVKTLKATVKSKKLKNKKKLFVKVRAYTLNGKTKKYGRWSDIRKVKVK